MFHSFIPERIRPWLYLLFAICFQLSSGIYTGALHNIMGERSLMREDVLMCLYCNLAGMAIYFPMLFRMKFRFTNKTLLLATSMLMALCNVLSMYVTTLPMLWGLCFFAGCIKLQGTFECISNIQLWITPKRDFAVFFPILHLIILCSMQVCDFLTVWFSFYHHWYAMHWLMIGIMLILTLFITLFTKHCRIMPKMPLYGIDWLGFILWALLALELVFIFNYGEFYDWFHSPTIRAVFGSALITGAVAIHRMLNIRHPYLEPSMWKSKHLFPILLLLALVEILIATENVLEESFLGSTMRYSALTASSNFNWFTILGVVTGSIFSLLWLVKWGYSYYKLIAIGLIALASYLGYFYFFMTPEANIEMFYLPVALRGFANCTLSAIFMLSLRQVVPFLQFFQSLTIFNMIHMFLGGTMGGAIYSFGLRFYISDNLTRISSYIDSVAAQPSSIPTLIGNLISSVQLISIKQLYGWALYVCIFTILAFLLYDRPYVRKTLRRMPNWRSVGRQLIKVTRIGRLRRIKVKHKAFYNS